MTYTLRVPFMLDPQTRISSSSANFSVKIGDGNASIAQAANGLAIHVGGFHSVGDAQAAYQKVWTGLANMHLAMDSAFSGSFPALPRAIPTTATPATVDNWEPCVFESQMPPQKMTVNDASISLTQNVDRFTRSISDGIAKIDSTERFLDETLRVAIELSCSASWELSERARLFTHTTVVEVLSPNTPRPTVAQAYLDKWREELRQARADKVLSPADSDALKGLRESALFAKDDSIRQRILRHSRAVWTKAGASDVDDRVRGVDKAYAVRSQLSHQGHVETADIATATSTIRATAKLMLEARMTD